MDKRSQKPYVLIFGLCLIGGLSGCVTTTEQKEPRSMEVRARLTDVNKVLPGMTRDDVHLLMGGSLTVGYEFLDEGGYEAITLKQPYREETITKDGSDYIVEYYFYAVSPPDDNISEDELMPLIFKEDKLIAKGFDAVYKLKPRP